MSKSIQLTGLWVKDVAGNRVLSGKTREAITLPAGTFVDVWKNTPKPGEMLSENAPEYNLRVKVPEEASQYAQPAGDPNVPQSDADSFF